MKKVFLVALICLFMVGCGKSKQEEIVKEFDKKVNDTGHYNLIAKMEIISNEEKYNYDVNVQYLEGDYYRVSLVNTENSHEQIILKNEDGVYVITPALNKSFKFQSEWPNNSSQSYILKSISKDLLRDNEVEFKENENNYVLISEVNYPNNSSLKKQKLTFDKNKELKKVEILDSQNKTLIKVDIITLNYKTKENKDFFALENNIDKDCCSETNVSSEIESVVYPMYIPKNTTYEKEEKIESDNVERVILTFKGEKPFILVEETVNVSSEFEINQSGAELVFYENIVGNLTDTSLAWHQNGIDYYIVGQNLSSEELLQIASSTATVAITK